MTDCISFLAVAADWFAQIPVFADDYYAPRPRHAANGEGYAEPPPDQYVEHQQHVEQPAPELAPPRRARGLAAQARAMRTDNFS